MRVEVYWNFHQKCYSVRALEGPDKGRVVHHSTYVEIADPSFVVRPAGREKVRREKHKNVHAFVRGKLVSLSPDGVTLKGTVGVGYNPYQWDSFMTFEPAKSGRGMIIKPIAKAQWAILTTRGIDGDRRSHMEALL